MRIKDNSTSTVMVTSPEDSSTNTSSDVTQSDDIKSTSDVYIRNDITSPASSNDTEHTLVSIEEEEEEETEPKETFNFDSNIDSVKLPTPNMKEPKKPKKPKKPVVMYETGHQTYMVLSVVVSVCFNLPIGLLAFFVSVKSSDSFKEGNIPGGHARARCSMVISMMGIVVTVTVIMLVVFYIAKKQRQMQYHYG